VLCHPGSESDRGTYTWEDHLWRLWTLTSGPVAGYSYLTPKRHIPYITDLDGAEGAALGPLLARLSRVLRDATDAELVHVRVLGDGLAHLHIHLIPHSRGDAVVTDVVRPGASLLDQPASELSEVARRIASALATRDGPD
jgi:diadenosine tetraphosphate (Ap4A) HIT family hydrolase